VRALAAPGSHKTRRGIEGEEPGRCQYQEVLLFTKISIVLLFLGIEGEEPGRRRYQKVLLFAKMLIVFL